jgi:hypothetical protein
MQALRTCDAGMANNTTPSSARTRLRLRAGNFSATALERSPASSRRSTSYAPERRAAAF